ncbi:MAG: DUF5665 domain-containing protein [Sporomusaceae bacterium]|nr:DUF5665 domain-containing protein [Sporomusaceae bacterium]
MRRIGGGKVLLSQVRRLAIQLEKMRIGEYMELLQKPRRLLFLNFIGGLARGFGIAVGATVVFALMVELLRRLILLNIPGIGYFIAEIVRIVETQNGGTF